MRVLIINEETDLDALSSRLLTARLSGGKTESALASLQALNPHVDLNKLSAGSVLLVPDAPGFKTSATRSVADDPLDGLQELVKSGLDAAAARVRAGNETRAAQRAEVIAVLKSSALKRIVERDAELKQQIEESTKQLAEDQQQAEESEKALQGANAAAQGELAALVKLLR